MTDYAALAAQYGGAPEDQPKDYGALAQQFGGQPVDAQQQQAPAVNKLGAAAFPDFLKQELQNAGWGARNIAGFGTAASNIWQKAKQIADVADPARVTPLAPYLDAIQQVGGHADPQQIEANKIIEKQAPIGAIAGNAALMAIPGGIAGNGLEGAGLIGGVYGAAQPISGDQSPQNVLLKTGLNAGLGTLLSMGGQAIANKAGDVISQKLSDLATKRAQNAPLTQTVNDALDAGLVAPPAAVNPTLKNRFLGSVAGKTNLAQAASNENAPVFDALARKAVNLPDTAPLEPATLQEARDLAYQAGYKPVLDTPYINWDQKFLSDLKSLSPASAGGAVKNPAQGEIDDIIGALNNQGTWTGPQLVNDIRELRNQASNNWRAAMVPNGNPGAQTLAKAQGDAADALEGLAQRNITLQGGSSDALQLMREARQYIAKTHDVEDAIVEGGGTINPMVLARKLQNGRPLSDELSVIARFANNFKSASKPAAEIQGPGVNQLGTYIKAGLGLATGSAGAAIGGPVGAAAGAALPFVGPPAMRSYLLSQGSQNALRDIYQLGLPTRMANSLIQYAPVGSTVLGLNALGQ